MTPVIIQLLPKELTDLQVCSEKVELWSKCQPCRLQVLLIWTNLMERSQHGDLCLQDKLIWVESWMSGGWGCCVSHLTNVSIVGKNFRNIQIKVLKSLMLIGLNKIIPEHLYLYFKHWYICSHQAVHMYTQLTDWFN